MRVAAKHMRWEDEMTSVKQAAAEFLAKKRVAVTGASKNPEGTGATSCTSGSRGVAARFSR